MNKIWIFKKWFSSFNFYKNVGFRLDILGFAGSCTKVYHSMLNSFQYFHINYQMSEEWKIDTAFFRSFYCDIFSTCIYGSSIAKIFAFRTRSLAQPKVIPNRLFEMGKSNFEEKNDVGWEKIVRFLKTIFFRHGIAFWLSSPHHNNSTIQFLHLHKYRMQCWWFQNTFKYHSVTKKNYRMVCQPSFGVYYVRIEPIKFRISQYLKESLTLRKRHKYPWHQ